VKHANTDASSPTWRIALLVLIVSSIIWLGGANIRALIGNQMLKFGTLEFDDFIAPEAEREIFRLLSLSALAVIGAYCMTLISSIVFLVSSPFRLKEHGWLLMSAILFYIFVPVEAFLIYLDGKMMYLEFFTTEDNTVFRELFLARLGALSGVPLIATLCYYTIIVLVVFQPMKRRQAPDHEA
jgi:hypothetical protein